MIARFRDLKMCWHLAAAVACLAVVGGLAAAEGPAAARLTSKAGTLFARSKPEEAWKTVAEKGEIHAGDLLLGLPGTVIGNGKGTAQLTFLTDLTGNSPYPILEAAVVLHASADHDLDFTLDRGRVDVTNLKKEGAARVRIRFHDQQWDATLTEPGTRIVMQLYGRWDKGVPFRVKPSPKEVPAADLLFLVRKGQVELKHGSCSHFMSAPPGPALLHWDNRGGVEEAPQRKEELPDWAVTEQSEGPRAQLIKRNMQKLQQMVVKSSPKETARALVKSADEHERRAGVIFLGALDDMEGLSEVINGTKYPDTWDEAVVVVRHWLGRCPGQDQMLYQGLIEKRGLKPAQAAGVMQLLHSFGDADLAQPDLYTTLVKYLGSDVLGIRGLAHWHLVRLVPQGKDIGYVPLDPKDKRTKAQEKWKKLIDDLLSQGKLPPKETAK
jgi:hypothetical protein